MAAGGFKAETYSSEILCQGLEFGPKKCCRIIRSPESGPNGTDNGIEAVGNHPQRVETEIVSYGAETRSTPDVSYRQDWK